MPEWIATAIAAGGLALNLLLIVVSSRTQSVRTDAVIEEQTKGIGQLAAEAKKIALDAHDKVDAANAAAGIYREMVAREFAGKPDLREMKAEIMSAIDRLGERVDRAYEMHRAPHS